ncbi:hypothetical protein BDF19DRAFT_422564 [Syncephalis fuscata]|nr:hypothetical protein BDF19DRAFT_422564 [Syncephalis fuscata]
MINTPAFTNAELDRSSLPLNTWMQHGQTYGHQQSYSQHSNNLSVHQQAHALLAQTAQSQPSQMPQSRKPIWMTSAAIVDSLPLGVAEVVRSVSPTGSISPPPPPTSTGSPVVNAAMFNAAAAHLMASATSVPPFSEDSPFASPNTPLDSFFRSNVTIASAKDASTGAISNSNSNNSNNGDSNNDSSLFNPFEQRYFSDFLNKFAFDSPESPSNGEATKPLTESHQPLPLNTDKFNDAAYPSPEPTRSERSLMLSTTAASSILSTLSKSTDINLTKNGASKVANTTTGKASFDYASDVKVEAPASPSIKNAVSAPSSTKRKRAPVDTTKRKRSLVDSSISCNVNQTAYLSPTISESIVRRSSCPSIEEGDANDDMSLLDDKSNSSFKKELLSEEQKRINHIRSEQKRRDAIRTGFQDLGEMVPALRGVRYSKSVMLDETVSWIAQLEADCQQLQKDISLLEAKCAQQ